MSEYVVAKGKHSSREQGMCAMEWTSFLAGEPHSDSPQCVSPMLTRFCVQLNDALPDGQRQRMRPYLARTIGTRGDGLDESRGWMCADWLIREYTPAFLALVPCLEKHAAVLRALPPVLAVENVSRAMVELSAARSKATATWAAAWAAARAAAWDAARDAAWAAARDAAWAAAGAAAGDAAGAAAGAAARDAARDAAWAAARDALAPTVDALQDSVLSLGGLLDRMLPLEPLTVPSVSEWREVCALAS